MEKISELRQLSHEALEAKLLSLREEQFKLRIQKVNGNLKKLDHVAKLRKTIARIKTIMTEQVGKSNVDE